MRKTYEEKKPKSKNCHENPRLFEFPKVTSELYRAGGMHRISLDERSYARHISWCTTNLSVMKTSVLSSCLKEGSPRLCAKSTRKSLDFPRIPDPWYLLISTHVCPNGVLFLLMLDIYFEVYVFLLCIFDEINSGAENSKVGKCKNALLPLWLGIIRTGWEATGQVSNRLMTSPARTCRVLKRWSYSCWELRVRVPQVQSCVWRVCCQQWLLYNFEGMCSFEKLCIFSAQKPRFCRRDIR